MFVTSANLCHEPSRNPSRKPRRFNDLDPIDKEIVLREPPIESSLFMIRILLGITTPSPLELILNSIQSSRASKHCSPQYNDPVPFLSNRFFGEESYLS